jgi:hypothetical protein
MPLISRVDFGLGAWIRGMNEWLGRAFSSTDSPNSPNNPKKYSYSFAGSLLFLFIKNIAYV